MSPAAVPPTPSAAPHGIAHGGTPGPGESLDAGAPGNARAARVLLFTDTLGDVNGVSRFIRDAADNALHSGKDLTVVTSTRFELPEQANILNFDPVLAMKMPRYENLELVHPPRGKMLDFAIRHRPTAIHVSTPGPVGMLGRLAARRLRVPLLGTYHTDFPAYIEHLFQLEALTWTCREVMAWFYRPFDVVFTRSAEYREAVRSLGVKEGRLETLRPGIRTSRFGPERKGAAVWESLTPEDASADVVRFLSVGRVSVEKNLPFLVGVWRRANAVLEKEGVAASLVVVGDGPYLQTMRSELHGTRARFLGFRHGEELSRIYASSDAFLFPSTTDTLGQVVLESQCSGLPVLVTDQGGPKGVVRDGTTGHVLSADEPSKWVEKILTLAKDGARRRAMGKAAHEYAASMTIEQSIDHFWDVHVRAASRVRRA